MFPSHQNRPNCPCRCRNFNRVFSTNNTNEMVVNPWWCQLYGGCLSGISTRHSPFRCNSGRGSQIGFEIQHPQRIGLQFEWSQTPDFSDYLRGSGNDKTGCWSSKGSWWNVCNTKWNENWSFQGINEMWYLCFLFSPRMLSYISLCVIAYGVRFCCRTAYKTRIKLFIYHVFRVSFVTQQVKMTFPTGVCQGLMTLILFSDQ